MMIPFWLVSPYDETIVVMQGTLGGERGMKLFVEGIVEFHQVSKKVGLTKVFGVPQQLWNIPNHGQHTHAFTNLMGQPHACRYTYYENDMALPNYVSSK